MAESEDGALVGLGEWIWRSVGVVGEERDGKQEREGMENGERMEMNIMLNDRRVHLMNSERA